MSLIKKLNWLRNGPLPVWGAILVLLYLWGVTIWHLSVEWTNNPQYSYGWAVPFLCAFLIARNILHPPSPSGGARVLASRGHPPSSILYLLLALLALLYLPTRLIQVANPDWRLVSWALALITIGLTLCLLHLWLGTSRSQVSGLTPQVSAFQRFSISVFGFPLSASSSPSPRPPGGDLSHLENGERSSAESRKPSGPSERERESQRQGEGAISACPWPVKWYFIFHWAAFQRFSVSAFAFNFPLFFFLVAVPWPTFLEGPLIQGLTRLDVRATCELAGWLGIPALPHGNVIEVATGQVGIDEACSGIRSFQATLMISLFLGEFYQISVIRRLFLCLAGFALAVLLNLVRQTVLVWVASSQGVPAIAQWHDPTGVIILLGCFGGLWGIALWLARTRTTSKVSGLKEDAPPASGLQSLISAFQHFSISVFGFKFPPSPRPPGGDLSHLENGERSSAESRKPSGPSERERESQRQGEGASPQASGLKSPISAFQHFSISVFSFPLALCLWLLLVEAGVEGWYAWRAAQASPNPSWQVAWPTNAPAYTIIPFPEATSNLLRFDDGLHAAWDAADGRRAEVFYLRWNPGRTAGYLAKLHTPQACLPAAGLKLVAGPERVLLSADQLTLPFQRYEFAAPQHRVDVFYCHWPDRGEPGRSLIGQSSWTDRFRNVWEGRGNSGQRVLEMVLWDYPNAVSAREAMNALVGKLIFQNRLIRVNPPPPT